MGTYVAPVCNTVGRDGGAFEVASVATALTEAVSAVVSAQLTNLIGL